LEIGLAVHVRHPVRQMFSDRGGLGPGGKRRLVAPARPAEALAQAEALAEAEGAAFRRWARDKILRFLCFLRVYWNPSTNPPESPAFRGGRRFLSCTLRRFPRPKPPVDAKCI
jgi:hypothetical protein